MFADFSEPTEKKSKDTTNTADSLQTQKPQNKVKRRKKPKPKARFNKEKEKNNVLNPKVEKAKPATVANEITSYKQLGPYVLIKGTKQVVVNCPSNEDESEKVTKRVSTHILPVNFK